MYTAPLSAINGLSRLIKLKTSKGAGMAESNWMAESNLEASQVPNIQFVTAIAVRAVCGTTYDSTL